ncbi:AI-2E family transporter [Tepidibacillus sp. HK-1]|uniref:AI-2E family transporter n=1 Tax=Tepidibacillus sp. HK-1 TaxID=1883407 RepID=UPI0008590E78|nr:AI-2E family transporter [Tepidibacillus sp. HK-1]GBF10077.1 AI-2 transport protein TqsA [Tepidibacillus sp. HK-1]
MDKQMENWPHKKLFFFLTLTILFLLAILLLVKLSPVIAAIFFFLSHLLLPFFISVIISYLLHPIVTKLHQRGVPRSIAVLLIYVVFFGSLAIILFHAFPLMITQMKELSEYLPNMVSKLEGWLENIRHNHEYPIPDSFQDGIDSTLENLEKKISTGFTNVTDWISNTIGVLFTIFLVPFVTFYILKDFKLIEKTVITFVPKKRRKEMIRLVKDIDEALGNYIRGQLLVASIVGIMAYIGYMIIGLPYSLFLAFIVAITDIIPYLGPFLGAAPAIIVGLSISWKMGLTVLAVNLMVQTLESNVFAPQIVGKSLHIHPLFIILSLLVGGEIGGIAGLILAVPIFAILKVIFQHIGLYYSSRL